MNYLFHIRGLFSRINLQIMQVAIVRPMTHFIAAVLWTNDSYVHGEVGNSKYNMPKALSSRNFSIYRCNSIRPSYT